MSTKDFPKTFGTPAQKTGRQNMRRLLKALWIKSCRHDGIEPSAMFICFSADNPYQRRYNRLMALYLASN